jgi:hypothetical protein
VNIDPLTSIKTNGTSCELKSVQLMDMLTLIQHLDGLAKMSGRKKVY